MNGAFDDLGCDPEFLGSEDQQRENVRKKLFSVARKAARRIPFMEDVIASYYCALDPATPSKVRLSIFAALAYFVLPLDAVPDFILGVGFGDDAAVLMGMVTMVRAHMREEHIQAARDSLKE